MAVPPPPTEEFQGFSFQPAAFAAGSTCARMNFGITWPVGLLLE